MSASMTKNIAKFAAQVENPNHDPVEKARTRGWLDASARPTRDGMDLVAATDDERGTRSAFQ